MPVASLASDSVAQIDVHSPSINPTATTLCPCCCWLNSTHICKVFVYTNQAIHSLRLPQSSHPQPSSTPIGPPTAFASTYWSSPASPIFFEPTPAFTHPDRTPNPVIDWIQLRLSALRCLVADSLNCFHCCCLWILFFDCCCVWLVFSAPMALFMLLMGSIVLVSRSCFVWIRIGDPCRLWSFLMHLLIVARCPISLV